MDVVELSIVMSQSSAQQSTGIAVIKMAMDTGKETASKMTEMMKNVAAGPNLWNHIDVGV